MLQGDDVLEYGQETGYRICSNHNDKNSSKVFSVHWDSNSFTKKVYICYQNGSLQTLESPEIPPVSSSSLFSPDLRLKDQPLSIKKSYNVKFRRYMTNSISSSSDERIIPSHFDKFATIPGRPNEFIFLLGISQKVYYSGLPRKNSSTNGISSDSILSSYTNEDHDGFVFGTPIMEINHHIRRVTSLAVSPCGSLLATGDETGCTKLLLLQHREEDSDLRNKINIKNKKLQHITEEDTNQHGLTSLSKLAILEKERKDKTSHHLLTKVDLVKDITQHRPFLNTYSIGFHAHEGSVFSLSWIPVEYYNPEDYERKFLLATGSYDHAIRLWQVSFKLSSGISVTPLLNLDIFAAHCLTIHSYISPSTIVDPTLGYQRPVYIVAGTNAGTVHVWKFPQEELVDKLKGSSLSKTNKGGLLSVLQVSDNPIIHISSSHQITQNVSKKLESIPLNQWYLAASDCKGKVSLYNSIISIDKLYDMTFEDEQNEFNDRFEEFEEFKNFKNIFGSKFEDFEQRTKIKSILSGRNVLKLDQILPYGEEIFESPIVSCTFEPFSYYDDVILFNSPEARTSPEKLTSDLKPSPELLVCSMDGHIKFYSDLYRSPSTNNNNIPHSSEKSVYSLNFPQSVASNNTGTTTYELGSEFSKINELDDASTNDFSLSILDPTEVALNMNHFTNSQNKTPVKQNSNQYDSEDEDNEPIPRPPPTPIDKNNATPQKSPNKLNKSSRISPVKPRIPSPEKSVSSQYSSTSNKDSEPQHCMSSVTSTAYSENPWNCAENDFSYPTLHSSKILKEKVDELEKDIEEMSVGTIETTSSDIKKAVQSSDHFNIPKDQRRYHGLANAQGLDSDEINEIFHNINKSKSTKIVSLYKIVLVILNYFFIII